MNTRRKFLADGLTVGAVFALVPFNCLKLDAASAGCFQSLDQISYPMLAGQINTIFRVRLSPRQVVELKLLKAPLHPPTPPRPGRRLPGDAGNEKFSLIFGGSQNELIASTIHRIEHAQLGRFEMYVGLVNAHAAGQVRYETVFNRAVLMATDGAKLTWQTNRNKEKAKLCQPPL